jgi:hypothetical protein
VPRAGRRRRQVVERLDTIFDTAEVSAALAGLA